MAKPAVPAPVPAKKARPASRAKAASAAKPAPKQSAAKTKAAPAAGPRAARRKAVLRKPKTVTIRSYQVGFGDCFLLSIDYAGGDEEHILIDFGTTKLPEKAPKTRMRDIAENIKERTSGKLAAIVATHRHQDHISGFADGSSPRASGGIIRELKPRYVLQPWTEEPNVAVDATAPAGDDQMRHMAAHRRSLAAMQGVARNYVQEAKRNREYLTSVGKSLGRKLKEELSFIGEDNIANKVAVENLMKMAKAGAGEYLHAGQTPKLAAELGVEIDVLGPPTVKQHAAVKKQRSRDPGEYWHLANFAGAVIENTAQGRAKPLFPDHVEERENGQFSISSRWLIARMRRMRGQQMLQIVRALDSAMNNTSLILLFRIGTKSFLFPGDAQIENWSYALSQPAIVAKLAAVDLYKVGHHGSLNATPLSLWNQFAKKSEDPADPARLATIMSTLKGKHGHVEDRTEVPRSIVASALRKHTDHFTTEDIDATAPIFWHDTVIDVSK